MAKYIGEAGSDDGGLFRDSITTMCHELQSDVLPLFIPCGNQVAKVGDNRDKWVVNPGATSSAQMKAFEFIGALIGMSIRSGILIDLRLPAMFWKNLTEEKVTQNDLRAIDISLIQNIKTMK